MRLYLWLILACMSLGSALRGQTTVLDTLPFAPPGATWIYEATDMQSFPVLVRLRYEGDTLYEGQICKQLSWSRYQAPFAPTTPPVYQIPVPWQFIGHEYVYESNDTVYWWRDSAFVLLYVFGARSGEAWVVPANLKHYVCEDWLPGYPLQEQPDTAYLVDTVHYSYRSTSGYQRFAIQEILPLRRWNYGGGMNENTELVVGFIIKNIGGLGNFFPKSGIFPEHVSLPGSVPQCGFRRTPQRYDPANVLLCYSDSLRDIFSTLPNNLNFCRSIIRDSSLVSVVQTEVPSPLNLRLYPNPGRGEFRFAAEGLDLAEGQYRLRVHSLAGQCVLDQAQYRLSETVRLGHLSPGLYIVSLMQDSQMIAHFKYRLEP